MTHAIRQVAETGPGTLGDHGPRHTIHGVAADGVTPVGSAGRFTETDRYLIITAYEVTDE